MTTLPVSRQIAAQAVNGCENSVVIDDVHGVADDAPMRRVTNRSYKSAPGLETNGKEDVTSLLVKRFQEMLRDGLLRQGSRLPPERDLAAHFNVARSSLRQALKVLEVMGVITQKVGDGSYLNTDTSAVLAVPLEFLFLLDDTSVGELTELRLLIEPGLARLAAERATADDIDLLRQSIRDFESSGGDNLKIVSSDLLFHRAIFQASKNGPATSVFHSIHRAMAKMILVTSQLVDLEHTLAFHKPIMQAIERRDGDRAARLMAEHLTDATALLTKEQEHQHQLLLQDRIARERRPVMRSKTRAAKKN